ncbi:MAG: M48 family metalloprotease [Phycisphaerae bacterium]|nr:M48 family metalloprotease [Phycisphaerae bacterium]
MQILVLILVAAVAIESRSPSGLPARPIVALAVLIGSPLLVLSLQRFLVRSTLRRLDGQDIRAMKTLQRAETTSLAVAWVAVLATAVATLGLGWLETVRGLVGNPPALDEMLAVLPAILAMTAGWWNAEPIERRIRESSIVRRLDEGLPVTPTPSRVQFVLERLRSGILLMLVPILIVVALGELAVPIVEARVDAEWRELAAQGALFACAIATYLVTPLIARVILSLRSMPPGELRDDLVAVCASCGVRVRGILLWDTHYSMVNGAVMGIAAPLRYVMLTDALLELLPRDQVRAVMAHEIGHVRRRHLPWMLGALVVLLVAASYAVDVTIRESFAAAVGGDAPTSFALAAYHVATQAGVIAAAGLALFGFGWVSRRFERQADAFAVQYLSRAEGYGAATTRAVSAMREALLSVAESAGIDPNKSSWRHGSIAWRRRNLERLVDVPLEAFAIDRVVRRLKILTLVGLVGVGALLYLDLRADPVDDPSYDSARAASSPAPLAAHLSE